MIADKHLKSPHDVHQQLDQQQGHRDKSSRSWSVTLGLFLLGCALVAGIGLPLALELRSSNLLEARLRVVRKILSKTPLIDG